MGVGSALEDIWCIYAQSLLPRHLIGQAAELPAQRNCDLESARGGKH